MTTLLVLCSEHPSQVNVYYDIDHGEWRCNVCGSADAVESVEVEIVAKAAE